MSQTTVAFPSSDIKSFHSNFQWKKKKKKSTFSNNMCYCLQASALIHQGCRKGHYNAAVMMISCKSIVKAHRSCIAQLPFRILNCSSLPPSSAETQRGSETLNSWTVPALAVVSNIQMFPMGLRLSNTQPTLSRLVISRLRFESK